MRPGQRFLLRIRRKHLPALSEVVEIIVGVIAVLSDVVFVGFPAAFDALKPVSVAAAVRIETLLVAAAVSSVADAVSTHRALAVVFDAVRAAAFEVSCDVCVVAAVGAAVASAVEV